MGQSIIVSSGKGGTGKTVFCINLGVALTELGKSVVLIDGSLTTPDVSLYLGVPFHIEGLAQVLSGGIRIETASFKHKSGLMIIPGNIHMGILKEFEGRKFRNLIKDLKKKYDFVLIDCAAGLGREAVSAIKSSDKMLIVANPEVASIVNSSKTIQIAKNAKVKPMGIILNRLGRFKKELKGKEMEPLLHNIPIIGRIPEDAKVPTAIRNSEAFLSNYPRSKISNEVRNIAHILTKKEKPSFWIKFLNFFKK